MDHADGLFCQQSKVHSVLALDAVIGSEALCSIHSLLTTAEVAVYSYNIGFHSKLLIQWSVCR